MSAFGGLILTNRGRILQSKAQAGAELKYTRMALGDGNLGTSSILELTALRREVMSLSISKLKVLTGGRATIGSILTNNTLVSGFYWRELGIFAQDPDLGEILYCYGNAGSLAEYIPAGGGADLIEKSIDVEVLTGNASNVSAIIDNSLVFATANELHAVEQNLTQEISTVNQKVTTHLADEIKHVTSAERTSWNAKETPDGARKKVEQTSYNTEWLNEDSNGIFTEVRKYRKSDGKLAMKSVLSGGTSPQYTTRTITYYGMDGITIEKTDSYPLTYNTSGVLIKDF